MKIALIISLLLSATCLAADKLDEKIVDKVVGSIGKIENSKSYPFGIKSIKIKGNTQAEREAYARKICRNTVVNNHARWIKSGQTNKFFEFLGARFCPLTDKEDTRKLNQYWISNLRKVSGLDF